MDSMQAVLVRIDRRGETVKIRAQNLKTGELLEFGTLEALKAYLLALLEPRRLR
jgi:hypothetical protein